MQNRIAWFFAGMLALTVPAAPAAAGTVTLNPLSFQWLGSLEEIEAWRTPVSVGAGPGAVSTYFDAALRLPAGAEITGLSYYYSATAGGMTEVMLLAADGTEPLGSEDQICDGGTLLPTAGVLTPAKVAAGLRPGADPVVRRGIRYLVRVGCRNGAYVWQVQVTYK